MKNTDKVTTVAAGPAPATGARHAAPGRRRHRAPGRRHAAPPRHAAPRRHAAPGSRRLAARAAAVAAGAGLAALTGCSAAAPAAASPQARVTVTASSTVPATATASAAATGAATAATTAAPSAPASPAPAAAPALGRLAGVFSSGAGFGQVKPSRIFNGGDPTGLLTRITWQSWGGATATGTGTGEYVGSSQSVATGTQEQATVVAFSLGTCGGRLMYRAVEWYFPQHGQAFQPGHYEDICTGTYVPDQ
jgi:hypothetical protein